ncbi:MAG TPA: chlorite dismutase family protein [Dehalococcoidia bacterium]|nr:chlorite dismutase family protein [Dehalococcoidia bacterium]
MSETSRPAPQRGPSVDLDPSGQVTQKEPDRSPRQFLNYAFFKLDPAFRRLAAEEQLAALRAFETLIEDWSQRDSIILRTYSLVGLRSDCDFMLWRISQDVGCFQEMQAEMNGSLLGAYLTQPYSFLALQKRSQYVNRVEGSGHGLELVAGQGKFLFLYPFVKTRAWYDLSPHARQGMMDEHINASSPFKGVRINTSYSYGIDDQEFVVSFDSDYPQEFVDLVQRLRYTEASLYTLRDTPMFTCAKTGIRDILSQLSGQQLAG